MPLSTKPLPQLAVPGWHLRFLLAVAIVAAASLLRAAVDPLIHDQIPYFIYVASVVVVTWFCDVGAGIFSTLLAAFAGNYLFVPPRYDIVPHGEDWVAMGLFSAVAFGLVGLVGRWKHAERSLHAHAQRLQAQADELRALHAEAERMNRVKDEFLATLSHELRTPMNAIVGWAHLLQQGGLRDPQLAQGTESILRNSQAQIRLIEDLLDVSRIISGKLHLHVSETNLADVVHSALEAVRPAAKAKDIEIHTSLTRGAVLMGDRDRLGQVVWNLLSNAVKFTPKHGRVDVSLEKKDSQIHLSVSDTGVGIEPEFLPHLFERFTQADGSLTRRHGGLGLGLAIARHIVELHGGTVAAESPGRDRGASFTVTLPVHAVAGRLAAPLEAHLLERGGQATESVQPLARVRVLVVDDEPDARELLQTVLRQHGAEVRAAASAREGYEEARCWRPDVLVADIGMPVEDGYSLLQRVRALSAEEGGSIPAAALTAYAQREDRERALAAGFQEFITKPVPPEALVGAVARLARRNLPGYAS